jgi:hypothetical protein
MQELYHFSIEGKPVGPLDSVAVKDRILSNEITSTSLAWRQGMPEWKPVKEIPELMEAFNELFSMQAAPPPPLPPTYSEDVSVAPPSLAGDADAAESAPAGLSALEERAYRFVLWLYRPWGGRVPWVRSYVLKNPKRGVTTAAVTLLAGVMLVWLTITSILTPVEEQDAVIGTQQQTGAGSWSQTDTGLFPPQQGVPPNWQENYRNWQQNQRDNQMILDDVYKYQRKSFDNQLESYGNATYDWKQKDDN